MKLNSALFILIAFLLSHSCFAQIVDSSAISETEEPAILPKKYFLLSPRLAISVPLPTANRSFKKVFVGVYEINVGLNAYVQKGAFIGLAYDYCTFRIPDNKIPRYNATMQLQNAGVKLGGDFYVGDRNIITISPALTIGVGWTKFGNLQIKNPQDPPVNTSYSAAYLKPEIGFFYLIEREIAVGFNLAYYILNRNFDPYELKLNEWTSFSTSNSKRTQYLNIGFSFYYNFITRSGK
jgi:hypothetical protein